MFSVVASRRVDPYGVFYGNTILGHMEFSYPIEITKDHFIEIQKFMWSRMLNEPEVHKWYRRVSLLMFVAVAAFAVFAIDFALDDPPFQQSFFLAFSGVLILLWYLAARWFHSFTFGRWTIGSRTFLGKETLTLSDAGIVAVGSEHRSECSWGAVGEVAETANLIVFFTDPSKGYICPKASVPDAEYELLLDFSRAQITQFDC